MGVVFVYVEREKSTCDVTGNKRLPGGNFSHKNFVSSSQGNMKKNDSSPSQRFPGVLLGKKRLIP